MMSNLEETVARTKERLVHRSSKSEGGSDVSADSQKLPEHATLSPGYKKQRSYVALGSNLNQPITQIQTAIAELRTIPHTRVVACSSLYQTPPLPPVIDQADFINAVVALESQLTALALLCELQKIEQLHSRSRSIHWGPRTLDLDLLLYGNSVINTPEIVIPHPEIAKRNFVLYPLAEIAPNLHLPSGENLQLLLAKHEKPVIIAL